MTFTYHEPESLDEAIGLLVEYGEDATVLAGGTAFALMYKAGLVRPGHVVGLRRISELQRIDRRDDGVWIGAHTTHRDVERSLEIRHESPMIAAACGRVASVRIRSQATLGGNLCHADPAQDPPPALIAADAAAVLAGPGGSRRTVPLDRFFVDYYTTVRRTDEILLGVFVPRPLRRMRSTYAAFLPGSADDYPTVSVAASVALDDEGAVDGARIAIGGAGPTPMRAHAVEAAIRGHQLTPARIADAANAAEQEVAPLGDVRGSADYKRSMAVVWTRRALTEVSEPQRERSAG